MTRMSEFRRNPMRSRVARPHSRDERPTRGNASRRGRQLQRFLPARDPDGGLLFDRDDDPRPSRVIRIDPASRTCLYWHGFVPDVKPVKSFLAVTLLSLGVPMILMGDEARRTQRGNNNAYCLDDETSWFDWGLLARHADVHRFVTLLNARRVLRGVEHERRRVSLREQLRGARLSWHGVRLGEPDWGDRSHSLALAAELRREEGLFAYLILNAYWEPLAFELPPAGEGGAGSWRRWIDTSLEAPQDIVPWQEAPSVLGPLYEAGARSVVVLLAELAGEKPLPHEPN